MPRRSEKKKPADDHRDVIPQIWGIVFSAIGFMVLVALISEVAGGGNILGPWFGAALADGLVYLFGPIMAFAFPLMVLALGIMRFRGTGPGRRITLFAVLLAVELCVLLAIPGIPISTQEAFTDNSVGNVITLLLQYLFGGHVFGPLFVTLLTMVITSLLAFPRLMTRGSAAAWKALRVAAGWVLKWFRRGIAALRSGACSVFRKASTPQPREDSAPPAPPPPPTAPREMKAHETPATEEEKSEDDEVRRRLEEQLREFRMKKDEPITISSPDTTEQAPEESGGKFEDDPWVETGDAEEPVAGAEAEGEGTGHDEGIPDDYYRVPGKDSVRKRTRRTKPYRVPSVDTIPDPPPVSGFVDRQAIETHSQTLQKTLMNFGIEGKVVNVCPGPVITRYEIALAPGIKVSKVVNLQDDISLAVGGQKIRIQAPIPGKAAIGIELPNEHRQIVYFKHVLTSDAFAKAKAKLPLVVGRAISGSPFVTDITKMPHLLIAGQTGSGKSVCINSFICSLLMTRTPEELRFILIDPKKVELSYYQGIPHLMAPVVTESKEAVKALQWGQTEMDRRYRILARVGARNIESFNKRVKEKRIKEGTIPESDNKPMPFIVIIVDELADLMLTASKDVEASIQRIAQLARAVGIHLIIATQRPSVDIITGPIKANLTSRIGFRTIQAVDSRTILGHQGAEKLLGLGDMLFLRSGAPDIERYHGALISEEDVERVVDAVRSQGVEVEKIDSFGDPGGDAESGMADEGDRDELFEDAARTIVSIGQGSTSLLQRRMKIGYARAGRLMDELERAGIVGPSEGSKAREVLITSDQIDERLMSLS